MKTLQRNRCIVYYALPQGTTDQTDAYGNITGVAKTTYGNPVRYERLSTRKRKGVIVAERFGLADDYIDTFVTDDMNCPITIDTHLWVDTSPYDSNGNLLPYTHVVEALLPSLNVIQVAAKEVSVS